MKHCLLILYFLLLLFDTKNHTNVSISSKYVLIGNVKQDNGDKEGMGNANVSYFIADGDSIPMKRVPEHKLKGRYILTIKSLEQSLTQAKSFYDTDQLEKLKSFYSELIKVKVTFIPTIGSGRPKWNIEPYKTEVNFYLNQVEIYKETKLELSKAKEVGSKLAEKRQEKKAVSTKVTKSTNYPVKANQSNSSTNKKKTSTALTKPAKVNAYFCNSGNVVKYHSSRTCRGLNACKASIEPISLKSAMEEMDACKICH